VCFVCLGNICRSPAAEAVMAQLVAEAGLSDAIEVASAGTARYHVGDPPDPRTVSEARRRGVPIVHRARQLTRDELGDWDLLLVMDGDNLRDVRRLAGDRADLAHVRLLRSFDPAAGGAGDAAPEVPDPYYGSDEGFALMFDLIEPACRGLLEHLTTRTMPEERAV
jgi:low molecular weight protein-tyrosine phosphatase